MIRQFISRRRRRSTAQIIQKIYCLVKKITTNKPFSGLIVMLLESLLIEDAVRNSDQLFPENLFSVFLL